MWMIAPDSRFPAMAERQLVNKCPPPSYSHQTRQYLGRYSRPGLGLAVIESWKDKPRESLLLNGKLPSGTVMHPDLSFDAGRVVFAFCDHAPRDPNWRQFFLWEVGVDGSRLRRLTGTPADWTAGEEGRETALVEDFDPCYLPDGGIAFVSTRSQTHIRCQYGFRYFANFLLYRADGDGANIRPLSFPETEGWPMGAYATPFPLSEDLFLAAYTPDPLVREGSVQREAAYCIACHGLDKTQPHVDLLGTLEHVTFARTQWPGPNKMIVSRAYHSLVTRDGLVKVAHADMEADYSTPKDYFAHAGRLANMLLSRHPDEKGKARVNLDRESFARIVDWLDVNAVCYGDYSWNKLEWREPLPEGERTLREHVRGRFGPAVAEQPFAALVNVALPEESRILKAPLSTKAGGWGLFPEKEWRDPADPDCLRMRHLVEGSIAPQTHHDVAGTCGRDARCACDSCWVRLKNSREREKVTSKVGVPNK